MVLLTLFQYRLYRFLLIRNSNQECFDAIYNGGIKAVGEHENVTEYTFLYKDPEISLTPRETVGERVAELWCLLENL